MSRAKCLEIIKTAREQGERPDLRGADLCAADLRGAGLCAADLSRADLRGADLSGADLCAADLSRADLRGADLCAADLSRADLRGADLRGANITGTCLDPANPIPPVPDEVLLKAGLEIDGDLVRGWRTAQSMVCGDQVYEPGKTHEAPWFSVDSTDCHPGIYMAGKEWLEENYPNVPLVRCHCDRKDLHHAGDKFRTRKLVIDVQTVA